MKVQSILSFLALYLVSGLNAQIQNDPSSYFGEDASNLSPVKPSSARAPANRIQQSGQVTRPAGKMQRAMGAASNRPVAKATSGPAQARNRPVSGSKQQVRSQLTTNSRGSLRTSGKTANSQMPGTSHKLRTQAQLPTNSQGNKKPISQTSMGQKPGNSPKQQTRGSLRPAGKTAIGQKPVSSTRQQAKVLSSKNTQGTQKPSGKPSIGQKPSANSNQQSNFDSLDNAQGNQEPSSQTTINQKPDSAPKVQAQPTTPSNTQANQGPNSQTNTNQKPGTASKVQAQPASPSNTQGNQTTNGQPQGGLNIPDDGSVATGTCRKIRAVPKMDIVKLLTAINKARGDLPPLKISPALIKASILKASSNTDNKKASSNPAAGKAPLSHSKECGYKGKSAIHYATVAKDENDLFNKLKGQAANISKIKDTKYKAFGAAKVGTKFVLTFGEE